MKRDFKLITLYLTVVALLAIAITGCGSKRKSIKIIEGSKKEIKSKISIDSAVNTKVKIDSTGVKTQDIFEQKYNTEIIIKYDTLGRVTESIYRDSGFKKSDKTSQKSKVDKTTQESISLNKDIQLKEKSKQEIQSTEKIKLESGVKLGWVVAALFFIVLGIFLIRRLK